MFHWSPVPHDSWMGGRPTYWPHHGLHSFKALPELGVEDHPDKFFSPPLQADQYWTKMSLLPSTPTRGQVAIIQQFFSECLEHMILVEMIELQIWALICGLEHPAVKYTCMHPHVETTALMTNCSKYKCLKIWTPLSFRSGRLFLQKQKFVSTLWLNFWLKKGEWQQLDLKGTVKGKRYLKATIHCFISATFGAGLVRFLEIYRALARYRNKVLHSECSAPEKLHFDISMTACVHVIWMLIYNHCPWCGPPDRQHVSMSVYFQIHIYCLLFFVCLCILFTLDPFAAAILQIVVQIKNYISAAPCVCIYEQLWIKVISINCTYLLITTPQQQRNL